MGKKYKYQTIDIIKEVIRVTDKRAWNPEEIYKLLSQISKEKTFRGFRAIYFRVGEFPEMEIYRNYEEEKSNE